MTVKREPFTRDVRTEAEAAIMLRAVQHSAAAGSKPHGWSDFRVEQLPNGRWAVTGLHEQASTRGTFRLDW
jgi:hypothetical protein